MTVQSRSNIQKTVSIPSKYNAEDRQRIGQLMVDQIRTRTRNGISLNGTAFKYARKSPHKGNNLDDSGDMLAELGIVSHTTGSITVGYSDISTLEANQAEGLQIGAINPALAKPFIGITNEELDLILSRYDQQAPRPGREAVEEAFISSVLSNLGV